MHLPRCGVASGLGQLQTLYIYFSILGLPPNTIRVLFRSYRPGLVLLLQIRNPSVFYVPILF
jgi:hypothetical protein